MQSAYSSHVKVGLDESVENRVVLATDSPVSLFCSSQQHQNSNYFSSILSQLQIFNNMIKLVCLLGLIAPSLAAAAAAAAPGGIKCPEPNGYFADPRQCDKYYECVDNVPLVRLCPDGLLFADGNSNHERCDLPYNVDCEERTEMQSAQSSPKCPRKNGYFTHEDPLVCDKYYNCVDGVAVEVPCPGGLIYDDVQGSCTWPERSEREGCDIETRKRDKLPDGFTCPEEQVYGVNGHQLVHPTYAHPDDCQKFYICLNGIQPQMGSCSPGSVYSTTTLKCDDPDTVVGCENWFGDDDKKA